MEGVREGGCEGERDVGRKGGRKGGKSQGREGAKENEGRSLEQWRSQEDSGGSSTSLQLLREVTY